MPSYSVIVTFNNAPASCAQQEVRASGSTLHVALGRAVKIAQDKLRAHTKKRHLAEVGKLSWQLIAQERPNVEATSSESSHAKLP